ncbi:MAG: hypothetical protein P1P87_05415 [Trueperaceae bacterium]|nr:hypothetical protein [Trueperaceae bacterium]
MGLADRFARPGEPAPAATPPEITCPRYDPVPGTKRCKHYLKGGACSLPDEFMCVEWLKANGHHVAPPLPPLDPVEATPPSEPRPAQPSSQPTKPRMDRTERDLFGAPVRSRPTARSAREPEPTSPERSRPELDPRDVPVVRNLSDEDIASFKALNVEVCLATEDCGQIWLVPEYTGRTDRKEISARDAATLAAVCSAFPGARVTSFEKTPADEPR